MYILRTVQFLAVMVLVFHPICCDQNHTETVLNTTNLTQTNHTNATVSPEPAVVKEPQMLHTYKVYDNDTAKTPEDQQKMDVTVNKNVTVLPPKSSSTISSTEPTTTFTTQNTTRKHHGREGVTDEPITPIKNTTESGVNITQSITEIIPINVTIPHEIVPKKGVTFNTAVVTKPAENITSTTLKPSTTTTLKPKKPTVTIGSDDENLPKNKNSSTVKVPTMEYYQQETSKATNFVIPIVGVILSVPVVAIVLNILYKRGKEWWSHRHYRRMDFLVDGMYNN